MPSIITQRQHPIYTKRICQLELNRLAFYGGRDYIERRLWRAPNETDTQWFGDKKEEIVGRKDRSCLVNDAGRIANKIRQYIFKKPVDRDGIDDQFLANCAGDGVSVDDFMGSVCDSLTVGQWCWIQVDTTPVMLDENGKPAAQTEANKPKVFWRLWDSCAVPDWSVDPDGTLRWILVRTRIYQNANPFLEGRFVELSTLFWLNPQDGKVHITEEASDKVDFELRHDEVLPDLDRIPFVLIGNPKATAWWFDDVENIQGQVMNYDSMHNETLTDAVYPQLVVPMSLLNTLETDLQLDKMGASELITLQRELIKGRKNPFYENSEDRGITRYIQPSSGDLKMITEEQDRKRKILFDMCGLALFNRETRQVQTAEAKSFDQLDTNATLGNRALILQKAEKLAVELSTYFDPSFKAYEPVYNLKFDVIDVAAMSQTVHTLSQLPNLTPSMKRILLKCAMKIVLEAGGVEQSDYDSAMSEIDKLTDEELKDTNPFDLIDDGESEYELDEDGNPVLGEDGLPVKREKKLPPQLQKFAKKGGKAVEGETPPDDDQKKGVEKKKQQPPPFPAKKKAEQSDEK